MRSPSTCADGALRRTRVLVLAAQVLVVGAVAALSGGAPAAPDLQLVLKAESGLFGPYDQVPQSFVPNRLLPLKDGQAFGWRMQLRNPPRQVRVREELTLPAEPKTWGDPEPGLRRKTTPDGRTAVTDQLLEPKDGVISQSWTVTQGDPKGTWVIKVRVDDGPEHVFRFDAR
jgi:hypothetical protein